MQHTDKYQLNLIDRNDTFSPAPLNENAQKLEAELARLDAADEAGAAADAALDQRLKVFESRRLTVGLYKPAPGITVDVGFRPKVVIIFTAGSGMNNGVILSEEYGVEPKQYGVLTDTGFYITGYSSGTNYVAINDSSIKQYVYFAFG